MLNILYRFIFKALKREISVITEKSRKYFFRCHSRRACMTSRKREFIPGGPHRSPLRAKMNFRFQSPITNHASRPIKPWMMLQSPHETSRNFSMDVAGPYIERLQQSSDPSRRLLGRGRLRLRGGKVQRRGLPPCGARGDHGRRLREAVGWGPGDRWRGRGE